MTERIKKFFWLKTGRYLPRFSLGITCFVLIFSSILVFSSPNSSQKSEVNGVKSANLSANSGQKSSSSNSNFSSNSSSSTGLPSGQIGWNSEKIENLAVSSEIFSQNLAKSTETSAKVTDGVETVKPQETKTSQETAENQKNLIIKFDNFQSKTTVANTDDAIKSLLANTEEPAKSLLSNTEDAIKTDSAKIAQTQNKKLYQILEVVDGDTVKISEIGTLRLIGIDTPETKDPRKVVQCFGKEASENAKKLLSGQKVWLEFDESKSKTDKYRRTLAYIFREDGYFYNLEAVKNGFAHSYREYPHPKLDEFNLAEKQAREGKIGFWADNTCQGNTTQGVAGEAAKATVPPIGGTQEKTQIPKEEIAKPAAGNFDSNGDGKITCKDFKGKVTDPNILALYPKLDSNGDGVGCESN